MFWSKFKVFLSLPEHHDHREITKDIPWRKEEASPTYLGVTTLSLWDRTQEIQEPRFTGVSKQ